MLFGSEFSKDHFVGVSVLDDGSLKPRVNDVKTGEQTDLVSAFDKFLKTPTRPRRSAIHHFFLKFVTRTLSSLQHSLLSEFLRFDHGNDNEPSFDDQYLNKIKKVQTDLIGEIRQASQRQPQDPVGNAAIERLLEESGIHLHFRSRPPESILADSIKESTAIELREFFRRVGGDEFSKFRNYDLSLAQYRVRREGLTIRDNEPLVLRIRDEICVTTSALSEPKAVTSEEPRSSERPESQAADDHKVQGSAESNKRKILDSGRIWKHLTISRDETSASNFLHERLLILFIDKRYTCNNHDNLNHSKIKINEAANVSRQEQQSVSFTTYPRTGAMFNPYSSDKSPHQQASMARSPESILYSPIPFNDMDSHNHECSVVDNERGVDIWSRRAISSIAPLEVEDQSTKNDGGSTYENWKIIHLLAKHPGRPPFTAYIDKPVWGPGLRGDEFALKAFLPLTDVEGYVRQSGFDFPISREYSNECLQPELRRVLSGKQPPPEPLHHHEVIKLHSQDMIEAMEAFVTLQPGFWKYFPNFDAREPIEAPYMFWYTYGSPEALQQLSELHQNLMRTLTLWIDRNYEEKYTEAKRQLANGVVTLRTIPFLLFPGDVLVWKEKQKTKAAIASSLLVRDSPPILYWDSTRPWLGSNRPADGTKKGEFSTAWRVQTWSYRFDGEFLNDEGFKQITFKASSLDQKVPISKLGVHPLRFADEKTKHQLETRGRNFWACRHRNLVSSIGEEGVFAVCETNPAGYNMT